MAFTAHNVLLNDGSQTIPGKEEFVEDTTTFQAAVRSMRNSFGANLTGLRVVDLGCLEGGYAAGFARLGMISKGIEVRQSNLDNCEIVRQGLALPKPLLCERRCPQFGKVRQFRRGFLLGASLPLR